MVSVNVSDSVLSRGGYLQNAFTYAALTVAGASGTAGFLSAAAGIGAAVLADGGGIDTGGDLRPTAPADRAVRATLWHDGLVYAGGSFLMCSGSPAARVVSWDGIAARPLGRGVDGGAVFALTTFEGMVVVGGSFRRVLQAWPADVATAGLAAWDPAAGAWSTIGGVPFSGPVSALTTSGRLLYVSGRFRAAELLADPEALKAAAAASGGADEGALVFFDAATGVWAAVDGVAMAAGIQSLAAVGMVLYASGQFSVQGTGAVRVARWDRSAATWRVLEAAGGPGCAASSSGAWRVLGFGDGAALVAGDGVAGGLRLYSGEGSEIVGGGINGR
jgi:hypothetical protein